ncbi:MAG TPA: nucleotide exchange factor GrpE [Patescibacteria group bacterium]|nr:nucleotide exchange factor GrpE [Patescibacteria group bacterium]
MDNKKKKIEEKVTEELEETSKEVEKDSKEVTDLLQKVAETEDKYRRALADYQNLVRRTVVEKQEWARLSNKDLVLKLLPILDTLMLAEKHTKDQNFVLTVQQFLQALQQEGIERIKTVGEEYNPHLMEVVTTGNGEEGKVIEEVRAGYIMGEVVLRPAQVIVGKQKE